MEQLNPTEQETRHVLNVSEDDGSVTVKFLKAIEEVEDERQTKPEADSRTSEEDMKYELQYTDDLTESPLDGKIDPQNTEIDPQILQKKERDYWDKKVVSRSANVEREFFEQEKEEDRRVQVAFASEEPVERSFGYEILSHNEDAIDREFIESGRAPVLIDHDPSIDSQIGVVESISIGTDRKSRAVLRFSKESERADRVFRQIKEGIIQNISVGYYPLSMEKTEEEIEGRSVHIVNKWSPREISAVAIPADITVGIGRSESPNLIHRKEKNMTEEIQVQETPQVDANAIAEGIARNNKTILEKSAAAGRRDLGESAVSRGLSIEDFNGELIDAMVNNPLPTHHKIDMSQKEEKEFKRTYSLTNACKALSMGDWREAKYEQEISDEIQSRRGVKRGLSIPDEFWKMINDRKREQAMQTRVLTSGGATSGTQFVPVQVYGSEWIAALRAKMILPSLGVKFWEYRDKFNLPRVDTGSSVAYVSEGSAGAAQTPTTGSVSFVPYPITAYVDITREMMMMGDPQTDMWVAEDLTAAVATLLQSTAINGDGSSKPTGILQTSGIGNIAIGTNGGAPTWNHIVQIPQQVEIDDAAINDDTLYWLSNFKVKMKMAKTLKESSATNALMLLDNPYDRIMGDPVRFTTGVPSNLTKGSSSGVCSALIYGDFSQLIVNLFGGTDVIVDPYSQSSAAVTRIVVYQDNDIGIRHAQSFSACQDVTTN